jgi:hypothetical protein
MKRPGEQFQQLPMFMSAHEITTKYQPLDADRERTGGGSWGWDPMSSAVGSMPRSAMTEATPRSTHENEPDIRVYNATHHTATRGGGPGWRTGGGSLYRPRPDYEGPSETHETDTELWERKAEESADFITAGHGSLYESVEAEGVKNPVHLSTEQMGSFGKQQIIGGHHRIAVSLETDPHRLIPVLHQPDILTAKAEGKAARRGEGGYPYH